MLSFEKGIIALSLNHDHIARIDEENPLLHPTLCPEAFPIKASDNTPRRFI
jgi:hypothetical protein